MPGETKLSPVLILILPYVWFAAPIPSSRKSKVKAGDLVVYREEEFLKPHGIGLVVHTNPMYAFVKWSGVPSTQPFIANKKQLEVVSE